MTSDDLIEKHLSFLKAETQRVFAAQNMTGLKTSVIDQTPKISFMIKGQRSDTDRNGIKLLILFNKETNLCYIKNYYEISETDDLSCAVCPIDTATFAEDDKIIAALNNFFKSLTPS